MNKFPFVFLATNVLPEGGCADGWEERRSGGKQCGNFSSSLNETVIIVSAFPCYLFIYLFVGQLVALLVSTDRPIRPSASPVQWALTRTAFLREYNYLPLTRLLFNRWSINSFRYDDRWSCKSCPKRLTTCLMGARQCTDCKSPDECGNNSQSFTTSTTTAATASKPMRRRMMRPVNPQNRQQRQQSSRGG